MFKWKDIIISILLIVCICCSVTASIKTGVYIEKGERGEQGEKGDTGAQGPQGIQGERGEQGEKGDPGKDGADAQLSILNGYWFINGKYTGYKVNGIESEVISFSGLEYGETLNFTFRPIDLHTFTPYSSGYYMRSYYYDSTTQQNYDIYVKIPAEEYEKLISSEHGKLAWTKAVYTIRGTVVYTSHYAPNLDMIVIVADSYYANYI